MKVSNHNLQSILGNESHIDISSIYTSYLIYIYIHDSTHTFETYIHVERESGKKGQNNTKQTCMCQNVSDWYFDPASVIGHCSTLLSPPPKNETYDIHGRHGHGARGLFLGPCMNYSEHI